MKKILITFLLGFITLAAAAQDPQTVYGDYNYPGSVFFDYGLYIPVRDTTPPAPTRVGAMVILPQDTAGHTAPPIRVWAGSYWATITGGGGGVYFGNNGIKLQGNTFQLGGTLNQNTDIVTGANGFTLNGTAKAAPLFRVAAGSQHFGYREADSTNSGFNYTPNGKQGIFRLYAKGIPFAVLANDHFDLNDSTNNNYFTVGKTFLTLTSASGSPYVQLAPGSVTFSTSGGTPYAYFNSSYYQLPLLPNSDSTKYLSTDPTGKVLLRSHVPLKALDSAMYNQTTETIYFRYTTGGNLPVSIQRPGYVYREDKTYVVNRGQYGDPAEYTFNLIDTTLVGWKYEVERESFRLEHGYEWEYRAGGGFDLLPAGSGLASWGDGERITLRFYPNVPVNPATANPLKVVYYTQLPTDTIFLPGYPFSFSYIKLPELKNKKIMQVQVGQEVATPYPNITEMCADPNMCSTGRYMYRANEGAIISAMGNYFEPGYSPHWAIYYQDLPGMSDPANATSGKVISDTYSVLPEDSRLIISAASSVAPLDISLPTAAGNSGRILYLFLKNANGRTIKVDGVTITSSKTYVCDGSSWTGL